MTREEALNKLWPELNCKGRSTDGTANLIHTLYDNFDAWAHDLRVTIDHYIEQTSIYKGALDRKNEEIKDLIHSIESKNTRIKELEVALYKVDRVISETWITPSTCDEVENGLR